MNILTHTISVGYVPVSIPFEIPVDHDAKIISVIAKKIEDSNYFNPVHVLGGTVSIHFPVNPNPVTGTGTVAIPAHMMNVPQSNPASYDLCITYSCDNSAVIKSKVIMFVEGNNGIVQIDKKFRAMPISSFVANDVVYVCLELIDKKIEIIESILDN